MYVFAGDSIAKRLITYVYIEIAIPDHKMSQFLFPDQHKFISIEWC